MSLKPAVKVAKSLQFLDREVTSVSQNSIKHAGCVPLADYQTVSIRPVRLLWPDVHNMKIQSGEQFCRSNLTGLIETVW